KINNYIKKMINSLNNYDKLSFTFCVQLNETTTNNINVNVRIMTRLIIDKIEEENNYN
ncbi:11814_t:CDS:1, partial [Cetraspora pellucida]